MSPHDATAIHCPIGLYDKHEAGIERLTEALNHAPDAWAKAHVAAELREAVAVLLDCDAYDPDNLNCRLCRNVAALRDKTAALVEKVGSLAH